jgi:hypothetical protein
MAVQFTYVPIATQTLGSATATISFTSIPSTYQDLVLVCSLIENATATSENGYLLLNTDTYSGSSNSMSRTSLNGNGSAASSSRYTATNPLFWDGDVSLPGPWLMTFNFMNYANTNTYKTILFRNGNAGSNTQAAVGLWRNTAAINTIKMYCGDYNFTQRLWQAGSTFTLYGLAAA